jgi:hypothetical protein
LQEPTVNEVGYERKVVREIVTALVAEISWGRLAEG